MPEPTDMLIAYGELIICQIEPVGDTDLFRFPAAAGEVVTILTSRQAGSNAPCIELFDPVGGRIGPQVCDVFGARINAQLPRAGIHTLRVSEVNNDQPMPYVLSLERMSPPSPSAVPLAFGQHLADEINPLGDIDLYQFTGAAGDQVTILVSRQAGSNAPCVELFDPAGGQIGPQVCNVFGARIDVQLATSGIHTLRVSEVNNDQPMPYLIDLQCLGTCSSGRFASITLLLTGCTTCQEGDTFTVRTIIKNPTPLSVEEKWGVYTPDGRPFTLLDDRHVELPSGFTSDQEVSIIIPAGLAPGTYQFCGLLLELNLGRTLAESCQTLMIP
jgi:hypothetical protein